MARIVIVTNSVSGGGAERAMNILANELHRHNHEVTLLAINASAPDSISVICNVIEIKRRWRGSFVNTLKSWIIFQKQMKRIQPDLVVLNCDLPEFYGAISFLRAKIVAVEHVNYPWKDREFLGKLVRFILKIKKTTWVAVSSHLRVWPYGAFPDRVIFNPISEIHDGESRSSAPIKRLVFIGRLTFQKNPIQVIEIAHRVKLPALALGDGEDLAGVIERAQELKVNLNTPGFTQFPWRAISDGDLLIIPSRYEGDGLVVIEALQRNVPFIVSDIPEFRRFGLPFFNYASGTDEFVNTIIAHHESTAAFQVSSKKALSILSLRDINLIGKDWVNLIKELERSP